VKAVKPCVALAAILIAIAPSLRAQEHAAPPIPSFSVLDMRGRSQTYNSLRGEVTVVIFFSTRCPMSNAFNYRRNVLYHDYQKRVRFIVVDSNSNESLDEVRTYAQDAGFDFPVYHDVDNKAADSLGVQSTTETLVLDAAGAIRYRGYIEDAPNPERTTKQGLRLAIDAVLAGIPVETPQTRAVGCAIRRAHPQ